jgi:hypothetical protein
MRKFTVDDMMKAYADNALDLAKQLNVDLDFSEGSIELLEMVLEVYHKGIPKGIKKFFSKGPSEHEISQMSKIWGAYLGETIIKNLGGHWEISKSFDGAICLIIGDGEIYPPAKVYKRIINGSEDNVYVYYVVLKNEYLSIDSI